MVICAQDVGSLFEITSEMKEEFEFVKTRRCKLANILTHLHKNMANFGEIALYFAIWNEFIIKFSAVHLKTVSDSLIRFVLNQSVKKLLYWY